MSESGYYESAEGLQDVAAVCAGFPRSGSTFIWQLLRDMHTGTVVKTHCYLPITSPKVFVTIRDPRDCLVSQWRLRNRGAPGPMSASEMYRLVGEYQQWHFHAQLYAQQQATIVRYENWHTDPFSLRAALYPGYDAGEFRRLVTTWGFQANKARAAQLDQDWDRDTLLHPHHCHEGSPGTWRQFIQPGYVTPLTNLLGPMLAYWGYKQ